MNNSYLTNSNKTNAKMTNAKVKNLDELLIPWHTNGTLSKNESASLQQSLQRQPRLQRAIGDDQQLAEHINCNIPELDELLGQQAASLSAVVNKIKNGEGETSFSRKRHFIKRQKHLIRPQKLFIKPKLIASLTAIAASVVFVTVVGIQNMQVDKPLDEFEVQTSSTPADGPVLQVIFDNALSPAQIQALFPQQTVEILNGPSTNGVYRIRVDNPSDLLEWQNNSAVRWAEIELR